MRPLALLSLLLTCAAPAAPLLHSNPGAAVKLYLDFDGADAFTWFITAVPATPAYTGDATQVWARVAEKFAPFNVDVTTQDPDPINHNYPDGLDLRVIIGGNGSWLGSTATTGASKIGAFTTYQPNTAFVFSATLNGDPKGTAEVAAHEAGHTFGLNHHSLFDAAGHVSNEYDPGNGLTAPIMGNSLTAARGLWQLGPADQGGLSVMQDDLAVIASATNGFGYRPQDHGQDIAHADTLTGNAAGIIGSTADHDTFAFDAAGLTTLRMDVAADGPMLHGKLELLNASGATLAIADAATLSQTLTMDLPAGRYYAVAESHGDYGDVGQYTVSVPEPGVAFGLLLLLLCRR